MYNFFNVKNQYRTQMNSTYKPHLEQADNDQKKFTDFCGTVEMNIFSKIEKEGRVMVCLMMSISFLNCLTTQV